MLEPGLALNTKLFMNPDLKDALVNLLEKIKESSDFKDKLGTKIGNDEWLNLLSLFLLICELGTTEKLKAYSVINEIFEAHDELLDIAKSSEMLIRIFKDTVSENSEISKKALLTLLILSKNYEVCLSLVSHNLVYNLLTKISTKHPEHITEITGILDNISKHGKEIWSAESLSTEKSRIKSLLSKSALYPFL